MITVLTGRLIHAGDTGPASKLKFRVDESRNFHGKYRVTIFCDDGCGIVDEQELTPEQLGPWLLDRIDY